MMMRILLFTLLVMNNVAAMATTTKTSLSGKVTDKKTGETLPGVSVYLPDLKTGAVTDQHGFYKIDNLPDKELLVQVSYIGYQTIVEKVDLSQTKQKDFIIEESVKEVHEVVITGMSKTTERNRTPTSITSISHISMLQNSSTNIIDAIASTPGVSQITTGAGISKPVIRGLGYNRVVVVNDGIRQEGQQWGDEHGIEIDENGVNQVEVLKGPASLAFGSDAMAGVVNMISFPTLPQGKIKGTLSANYQTNNGLYNGSANLAGNIKGIIWDLRYSYKSSHAYKNKYDGYVFNSGFQEDNFNATIGINKAWGYSHLLFSNYHLRPGIVEGSRDSVTGKFTEEIALDDSTSLMQIVPESDFKRYTPVTPYQQIHHKKIVWNNQLNLQKGTVKAILAYQQNQRQEFANIFSPSQYGLYFLLNTFNYDIRYVLPEINDWNLSTGINGMYQQSKNQGTEFLVPEYNLFDVGGFFIAKKTIGQLDISGGLRYDHRTEHGEQLILDANGVKTEIDSASYTHKFMAFTQTFQGLTGSIGAACQLSKIWYSKLNISRGFRAPNIGELAANGEHEGTNRYEIGDASLKPENSWEIDYSLGLNSEHITFELDLFDNRIQHFIYQQKLNSVLGGDSITDGLQTFKFVQGNANLVGAELMIDIHPHPFDWLHLQNAFSFVRATQLAQPDSLKYLPLIPAARLRTELKIEKSSFAKVVRNAYFKIDLENTFAQNRYFNAFGTETSTKGYTLLNAGFGGSLTHKKHTYASLYVSVNNITDKAYQSHLSRLKYADINAATGRRGVYNMGRNVSVKLIVPIELR